uniref:Ribonuclease P/MRP 38 subunit n=1 Tax=Sphaeramia orbicularis TaxID=375764 RepID=A0A673ARP5_9TELE
KTSFTSPFTLQWSPLPQEDMLFILKTLKEKLIAMGFEKKEVKVFRQWKKKKGQKPEAASEPVVQVSQEPHGQVQNGWTDVAARRQLAIGINEVTKALERNELKLLLVCKSVKPKHMTDHLIALSATRGVPACQVPRLSQSISEPLGLKSVLALGFRQCPASDNQVFTDTVKAITPRVPSLDVAWLQGDIPGVTLGDSVDMEMEEEGEGGKRGQKRKLESESDQDPESASSCTLQPLKVKRVYTSPSPQKIFKKNKKTSFK